MEGGFWIAGIGRSGTVWLSWLLDQSPTHTCWHEIADTHSIMSPDYYSEFPADRWSGGNYGECHGYLLRYLSPERPGREREIPRRAVLMRDTRPIVRSWMSRDNHGPDDIGWVTRRVAELQRKLMHYADTDDACRVVWMEKLTGSVRAAQEFADWLGVGLRVTPELLKPRNATRRFREWTADEERVYQHVLSGYGEYRQGENPLRKPFVDTAQYWDREWTSHPTPLPPPPDDAATILNLLERRGPFRRVLDVGCGMGRWTELLKSLAEEYIGVDTSPVALRSCMARHISSPGVSFLPADRMHLVRDADLIFMCKVLIHVESARPLLKQIAASSSDHATAVFWEAAYRPANVPQLYRQQCSRPVIRRQMVYRTDVELQALWGRDWCVKATHTPHGDPDRLYLLSRRARADL